MASICDHLRDGRKFFKIVPVLGCWILRVSFSHSQKLALARLNEVSEKFPSPIDTAVFERLACIQAHTISTHIISLYEKTDPFDSTFAVWPNQIGVRSALSFCRDVYFMSSAHERWAGGGLLNLTLYPESEN